VPTGGIVMYVFVDGSGRFRVHEAQDLSGLKLVTGLSPDQLHQAFNDKDGPVFPDNSRHVWISQAWLRAQGPADDTWTSGFEKMMQYARSRGWEHPTGCAVRVHVERTSITL
jgi:hypothetical protein